LLSALAFLWLAQAPLAAQLLEPGEGLLVASTEHFDFYYPARLSASAERLASMAETMRASLLPLFGASGEDRFPVLLTDILAETNGYFTVMPTNRIVLYVTAPEVNGELGGFGDPLELLFRHELSHALSVTRKSPAWKFASILSGDVASPAFGLAPENIIEGAAVFAESTGGRGRLQDPEAMEIVSEILLEGKRPDFWQTAGAFDAYPAGSLWYFFGGAFTAWTRERHGDGAYAAFWAELSKGSLLPGIEDGLFVRGAYHKAFGATLESDWSSFLSDEVAKLPEAATPERLTPKPSSIAAIAARGGVLYWADAGKGAVFSLDSAGRVSRILPCDGHANGLSVSSDGRRLLLSSARKDGARSSLIVREYDLAEKRWIGAGKEGLREASYFVSPSAADAYSYVAIAVDGITTSVALARSGRVETLARGDDRLAFGSPRSMDGRGAYAIASLGGSKAVVRLAAAGGEVESLTISPSPLSVTDLSLDADGSLVFGLAIGSAGGEAGGEADGSFYRLATLGTDGRLALGPVLAGGVHLPVCLASGEFRYSGHFSDGDYLCRTTAASLAAGREAAFERIDLESLRGGPEPAAGGSNVAHRASGLPLAFRTARLPTLSDSGDAVGAELEAADLTGRLGWNLGAQYAWKAEAANLDVSLSLALSPWTIGVSGSDTFAPAPSGDAFYRSTDARIEAQRAWSFFPIRRTLALDLFTEAGATAAVGAGQAYASPYADMALASRAKLGWSDRRSSFSPPFSEDGYSISAALDAEEALGVGATLSACSASMDLSGSLSALRLSAALHAQAALSGGLRVGPGKRYAIDADGSSRPLLLSSCDPIYYEYKDSLLGRDGYAEGELSSRLVSIEVQHRLLGPLYVRRVGLSLGARAAYLADFDAREEGVFLSSAFASLDCELSPLVGIGARAGIVPRLEAAWAFSGGHSENGPLSLRLLLGVSY
jgi:hypothetical protein